MEITLLRKTRITLQSFITSSFNKIYSDTNLSVLQCARLFEFDKLIQDIFAKEEKIDEVAVEEEIESIEHYREIYYEIIDRVSKLNVEQQKQLPVLLDFYHFGYYLLQVSLSNLRFFGLVGLLAASGSHIWYYFQGEPSTLEVIAF